VRLFKRNEKPYLISTQYEWEIEQRALALLVARHPNDYMALARAQIQEIPNGGSILPWRHKRQIQTALDDAEYLLVEKFPSEWLGICQMLQHSADIATASPEDFDQ
jgi:hypothetical protein